MSLQSGTTLGPYEVVAEIGKGGMGEGVSGTGPWNDSSASIDVL